MPEWTPLLRVMRLLYHGSDQEIEVLTNTLIEARTRAWTISLQNEARRWGWTGPVNPPTRTDLDWIRRESRQDAQSIIRTWNRDVDVALRHLYGDNPRGNRFYYGKHMEHWATERQRWKEPQIAIQTEFSTAEYTKNRFWTMNGLRGGLYVLVGPPPVCGICAQWWNAGVVGQAVVDANPAPFHIACPHGWLLIVGSVPTPPPNQLWVG